MTTLSYYTSPIITAALFFPLIALIFTVPYIIYQFRKYGALLFEKTAVIYLFIFYMMCLYFLTILPLPDPESVMQLTTPKILPVPFTDLIDALQKANFSFGDRSSWVTLLTGKAFFMIVANIVMFVPLGIYLRYFFRCGWKKTMLICFLVSLSCELIQLSGLFFIYPRPYRFASTDDLMNNTLGGMIGFLIAPLFMKFLPSPEQMEKVALKKGVHIPVLRLFLALATDWSVLITAILLFALITGTGFNLSEPLKIAVPVAALAFTYFVLLQRITHGRTLGKMIFRFRLVSDRKFNEDGSCANAGIFQIFFRYLMLYGVYFSSPFICFYCIDKAINTPDARLMIVMLLASLLPGAVFLYFAYNIFIYTFTDRRSLIVGKMSHTKNISTISYEQK